MDCNSVLCAGLVKTYLFHTSSGDALLEPVHAAPPREVEHILVQNRERLVALLTTGLVDEDDESFEADKHAVPGRSMNVHSLS